MKATIEALKSLGAKHNASFYRLTQGYKKFAQKKIGFEFVYPAKKRLNDNGLWIEFHGRVNSYDVSSVEDAIRRAIKRFTEEVTGNEHRSYLCLVSNNHEVMIDNHDKDYDLKRKGFYQSLYKPI